MTMHLFEKLRRHSMPAARFIYQGSILGMAAALATLTVFGQTSGTVAARLVTMTPHLKAYAQVESIRTLPVNAAETGVISGLTVVPGMHVHAGQVLASLRGVGMQSLLLQDKANLRSAAAQLDATKKSLAIQREQLHAHLSTRESIHQAMSAFAQAQAAFKTAQSKLQSATQLASITAPADAIVLELNSSNGELVSAGQPVVALQPAQGLFLHATYYGKDIGKIREGITGIFHPADGAESIPVRVRAVAGVAGMGGGESVLLTSSNLKLHWLSGEFGTVTLNLPSSQMVAVPTRSLVLDQGKWWVMVHTLHGDRPQKVNPGPAHGWNTYLLSGIAPGTQVVVTNAYLLFHSSITEHYQIPD